MAATPVAASMWDMIPLLSRCRGKPPSSRNHSAQISCAPYGAQATCLSCQHWTGPLLSSRMSDWPAAFIFDFDGIIVNSEPLHFRAFREVLADEGIDLREDEYYAELIGFDDRGAIRHVLSRHRRLSDDGLFDRLLRGKSRRMQEIIKAGLIDPLPGAAEFIRGLKGRPLAICSGALRAEIEMMLDGLKLRENFPVIVAAEDVAIGKPDPGGYLLAMRLLAKRAGISLAPGDCLVIEDAPIVIESVREAGFKVLGVASTYPAQALKDADYVASSLRPADVMAKIPQLNFQSILSRN